MLLETFAFSLTLYWMAGLALHITIIINDIHPGLNPADNGLRFCLWWLVFVMIEFSMGNFIRMCTTMARDISTVQVPPTIDAANVLFTLPGHRAGPAHSADLLCRLHHCAPANPRCAHVPGCHC